MEFSDPITIKNNPQYGVAINEKLLKIHKMSYQNVSNTNQFDHYSVSDSLGRLAVASQCRLLEESKRQVTAQRHVLNFTTPPSVVYNCGLRM